MSSRRSQHGYLTEWEARRLLDIAKLEAATHGWKPEPATIPPLDPGDDDDSPAFVYFCQSTAGGPIKIGVARQPSVRLAALQSGSPIPLKMLAILTGGVAMERSLHKRFADWRLHGEWFDEHAPGLAEVINEANEELRLRLDEREARRALRPPLPPPRTMSERMQERRLIEWRG